MASQIFPLIYRNHQEVGVAVERYEVGLRTPVVLSGLPLSSHYPHYCLPSRGLSFSSAMSVCHAMMQKQSSSQKMTCAEF